MAKSLLIIFGGTTQSEEQKIFTPEELSKAAVDVLQINLLTTNSNIIFKTFSTKSNNNQYLEPLDQTWLEANPSGILRDLEAKIKLKNSNKSKELLYKLKCLGDAIEETNWSSKNYTKNSDARGMTEKTFNNFSQASQELILSFLNYVKQVNTYENIFILAHSRGCSLAINTLSKFNLDHEILIEKLKRVVLLDPVAKNVNYADETIIPKNAETIKKLSSQEKEIHIIVKSELANYNYESFADRLVGTRRGRHINCKRSKFPDMRNVYVHIAHMAHEGMLTDQFRGNNDSGFKHYYKIIDQGKWEKIYSNDKEVDLMKIKKSPALQAYIKGEKSASEITPEKEDVFDEFFTQFKIAKLTGSLKDRRRAFIHCLAKKIELGIV
ncbi:MAG: alpha/beta hydrolase [Symploca sp. SIO2C1]|nr:alpha/beta hydrolase [Symploca sp. SIO2C1]